MKSYALAVVLLGLLSSTSVAQPPVYTGQNTVQIYPPGQLSLPNPVIPTPRWMFSGPPGVLLYDSGWYLLGGTEGMVRTTGAFTMGPPGVMGGAYAGGYSAPSCGGSSCGGSYWGCFRR